GPAAGMACRALTKVEGRMENAKGPPIDGNERPGRLAQRLGLARAALGLERLWPSLWPAVGVAGVFFVLAFSDLLPQLPGFVHLALLVLAAVLFVAGLVPALRHFRLPGLGAGRRRIEQASGLAHRPLTALDDRLAAGANDPGAQALWQAHRARMAARAQQLRVG